MGNLCFSCCVALLLYVYVNAKHTAFKCTSPQNTEAYYESSVHPEDTFAEFKYNLSSTIREKLEDSDFRIELKLCVNGAVLTACRCRWISLYDSACKNLFNNISCETDNSEMRFSLLVRRTYSEVTWIFFKHNSTPVVLKHTVLQVIYPAKITGLRVNGHETNGTYLTNENKEVNISCSFTNGNPPVSIRIVDSSSNILSSTNHEDDPLVLSLGAYRCHEVWPTIRCEAPGSELNRSVSIFVKCRPQLSYTTTQVLNLKTILSEGLTIAMKSYTSEIRNCLMTQTQPLTSTREVNCKVGGHAPVFRLTVSFLNQSWIGEGIWTLLVISELGDSSITFQLLNKTEKPKCPDKTASSSVR